MRIHRSHIVALGFALAVAATSYASRTPLHPGQTPQLPPQLPKPQIVGTAHHVKGTLEKGSCPLTLEDAVLSVKEYWYENDGKDLELPGTPTGVPYLDPLMFQGKPLVQGRVLGSQNLAGATAFDVTWNEVATATRVPWVLNVQNNRSGQMLSVYRLLRLEVQPGPNYLGQLNPTPLISFFGTETTKDVGRVKVDCIPIGG